MRRKPTFVILACLLAWSIVGVLWLSGCGGGGGGSSPGGGATVGTTMAAGKVILPAGSKLSLAALTVNSGIASAPISPNGAFTLQVIGSGPNPITLQDKSGHMLLMGFADSAATGSPYAGGKGEVSATQTAVHLIYQATMAPLYSVDAESQTLSLIEASPLTSSLAATISSRFVANSLAISSEDSTIFSQVTADAAQILGVTASSARPALHAALAKYQSALQSTDPASTVHISVQRDDATGGLKTIITPTTSLSGVTISDSGDGSGTLIFTNSYRRRACAFIYESAVQANPGPPAPTAIIPAKPQNTPAPSPITVGVYQKLSGSPPKNGILELNPAAPLNGFLGSLVDMAFKNSLLTPGTTTYQLQRDGSAYITEFTIVLIGPGLKSSLDTFPLYKSAQFPYGGDWKTALSVYDNEECIADVLLPIVTSLLIPDGLEDKLGLNIGLIQDIVGFLAGVNEIEASFQNGDVVGGCEAVLQSIADFGSLREPMITAFAKAVASEAGLTSPAALAAVTERLKGAFSLFNDLDLAFSVINATVVGGSALVSNTADRCTVDLTPLPASITPIVADVYSAAPSIQLTVSPPNPKSQYVYHWAVTGTADGNLNVPGHDDLTSFDTSANQAVYKMSPNALSTEEDQVQVKIYQNAGTNGNLVEGTFIGQATSRISVTNGCAPVTSTGAGPSITAMSVKPNVLDYGTTAVFSATVDVGDTGYNYQLPTADDVEWTVTISGWNLPTSGQIIAVDNVKLPHPVIFDKQAGNMLVRFPGSGKAGMETHTVTFQITGGSNDPSCFVTGIFGEVAFEGPVVGLDVGVPGVTNGVGATGYVGFNVEPGISGTGYNGANP